MSNIMLTADRIKEFVFVLLLTACTSTTPTSKYDFLLS